MHARKNNREQAGQSKLNYNTNILCFQHKEAQSFLLVLKMRQARVRLRAFDLEGFVMSPGQGTTVAIEKTVIMLAVSASKIERGSARRIGHQNNG
jgi:hypothetical protein